MKLLVLALMVHAYATMPFDTNPKALGAAIIRFFLILCITFSAFVGWGL